MKTEEKLAMLEDMFELETGALAPDMQLADLGCWDSMAALSLIVLMNEEFSRRLDSKIIKGFRTVGDIMDLMARE